MCRVYRHPLNAKLPMQSIRMDITKRSIFPLCSKACHRRCSALPFFEKPISAFLSHPDN